MNRQIKPEISIARSGNRFLIKETFQANSIIKIDSEIKFVNKK